MCYGATFAPETNLLKIPADVILALLVFVVNRRRKGWAGVNNRPKKVQQLRIKLPQQSN
jgi:hypothetical protein